MSRAPKRLSTNVDECEVEGVKRGKASGPDGSSQLFGRAGLDARVRGRGAAPLVRPLGEAKDPVPSDLRVSHAGLYRQKARGGADFWLKKAGAKKAPTPAAIRAIESTLIEVLWAWVVKRAVGDDDMLGRLCGVLLAVL